MKFIAIIPSRYASSRFPGKALALIQEIPMILRVYQQVSKTPGIDQVYVATDDIRIARIIEEADGDVIMTSEDHPTGTSRCKEAKDILVAGGFINNKDIIINIQGDEPFIDPKQIQLVMESFASDHINICTLVKKIESKDDIFDDNVVKVVVNQAGKCLLFSRQAIPFLRDAKREDWIHKHGFLKHIGLYAYRAETLDKISQLNKSSLEEAESLEQLTWIVNGFDVFAQLTTIESIGIDVPEDLLKFNGETW